MDQFIAEKKHIARLQLHNRRYYAELVPKQLRYGLSLFFHYIREARGKAHAAASAYFSSQDYFGTIARIEKTCKQPKAAAAYLGLWRELHRLIFPGEKPVHFIP